MADDATTDLSGLSDEELAAKEQELVGQFDAADEADNLDEMSALAGEIDSVRAEIERRGTDVEGADGKPEPDGDEAAVAASATATLEQESEVTDETTTEEATEAVVDEPVAETTETTEEAPASEDTPTEAVAEAEIPTPIEASAEVETTTEEETVEIPEDRQPVPDEPEPTSTITAGADVPGVSAGFEFRDRAQLNDAFVKRIESISRARGGDGERHIVATITAAAAPEGRILVPGDLHGNMAKIQEVTGQQAIVASGGYCAPLETRYEIFGTGVTDRPVRDALAGFQARRGGIRYNEAPKIADYSGALGTWTAANDAENPPTTPAEKPFLKVECADEQTATLDAITLELEFGNLMSRAYPELVDRHNQLALVAHARYAENVLLGKIAAVSTAVTSAFKLGYARDWLVSIAKASAAYRWRYRMNPSESLHIIAPAWVRDAIRADLIMQLPGDDKMGVADAWINSQLAVHNVNVSWHLDGVDQFPEEVAASTLDDFPATFDWFIYAEGALLFLDGGTLDLGVVRDSGLVGTNDYRTFTETFEGVAKVGADVIQVTTTTHAAGGSVGTVAVA